MNPRVPVIMLPGMDGTGELFGPLVSSCPPQFEPIVVRYECDRYEDSEELLARIERAMPATPAVLLAESFSGGLAIRFAAQHPQRVKAVVLCNAFVRPPAPSIARLIPWSVLMRVRPTAGVVRRFLVGETAPAPLVEQVRGAIRRVLPRVLASRLRSILTEDSRTFAERVTVPVLYLRGAQDMIVGDGALRELLRAIPATLFVELPGAHLLLQTNPEAAWAEVQRFAG